MDNFEKLKGSISPIVSFTKAEMFEFCDSFDVVKLNKNEFFLQEGQVCNFIGFLNQGVLIYFKSMDNGNEVTTDFAFEGDWVNNNLSRLSNTPSELNIKAIEDSELLVIKQSVLQDLYLKIPKVERLGRLLMESAYLKIVQQSIDLQVLTAKDRYENLLRNYPEVFQKVPLYHIANYVGIAPKSLSRIRKEIFGK